MQCLGSLFFLAVLFFWLVKNSNEVYHEDARRGNRQKTRQEDERYFERLFVLDAAEHGFFVPGAERVFEDETDEMEADGYAYEEDEPY